MSEVKTTLETLRAARDLLSDPARWTKGAAAKDERGESPRDIEDGVCFCAIGAIWRFTGSERASASEGVLAETVRRVTLFGNPVSFNDHPTTTHADVLRVFDAAIAQAEAEWGDGR